MGIKRQILGDGYYDTFNRDNVTLVDLREDPIVGFYPGGVRTKTGDHPLDTLVLATGFDAITGTLQRLNPSGRGGVTLNERWKARFNSYLGITIGTIAPESVAALLRNTHAALGSAGFRALGDCVQRGSARYIQPQRCEGGAHPAG